MLRTDNSGHTQEQNTYLLRGKDSRYFAAYLSPWGGETDYIKPLGADEAQKLYNSLPFKNVDFDSQTGQPGKLDENDSNLAQKSISKGIAAAVVVGFALVVIAIVATLPEPGKRGNPYEYRISSSHYFGCSSRAYFEKLVRYLVEKDTAAFAQGLDGALGVGICTTFKAGEPVFLVESATSSGMVKIRREGSIAEYWTNSEAIH